MKSFPFGGVLRPCIAKPEDAEDCEDDETDEDDRDVEDVEDDGDHDGGVRVLHAHLLTGWLRMQSTVSPQSIVWAQCMR